MSGVTNVTALIDRISGTEQPQVTASRPAAAHPSDELTYPTREAKPSLAARRLSSRISASTSRFNSLKTGEVVIPPKHFGGSKPSKRESRRGDLTIPPRLLGCRPSSQGRSVRSSRRFGAQAREVPASLRVTRQTALPAYR